MAEPKLILQSFSDRLLMRSAPPQPDALLVTNHLGSTIIGYTLLYRGAPESGEPSGLNRTYYNFGVSSNGVEIPDGATQFVMPQVSHRWEAPAPQHTGMSQCGAREADPWFSSVSGQSVITISIDLVILDSGKVLGPDEGGTLAGLKGVLSAYAEIRAALAQNRTQEDLEAEFTRKFNEEREIPGRTAMMRGAEFRHMARLAGRSKNLFLHEVAKREANFRPLSLSR